MRIENTFVQSQELTRFGIMPNKMKKFEPSRKGIVWLEASYSTGLFLSLKPNLDPEN